MGRSSILIVPFEFLGYTLLLNEYGVTQRCSPYTSIFPGEQQDFCDGSHMPQYNEAMVSRAESNPKSRA